MKVQLTQCKLGYGGTKEEMGRLLEDAERIAGLDMFTFSIDSFADIVQAIHIVQDNMGITGTTAREASETISGSIGSLKSAWENLVTGFSNPDADLGVLIENVVSTAETALGNLLPVVVQALSGLASAIGQVAPIISEKLPGLIQQVLPPLLSAATSLLNGVISALPGLLTVLGEAIPMVVETLTSGLLSALPELIPAALAVVTSLAESITSFLPELIPVAVDAILQLVETLTDPDNISNLVDAAIAITMGLANGLISALPTLLEKAPIIIRNLVTAIIENVPKLIEAAFEVVATLVSGIVNYLPELGRAAGEIIGTLLSGLAELWTGFLDAGRHIVEGIWEGIKGAGDWLWQQIKGFFGDLLSGICEFLGIASPSKLFADKVGRNLALGIGVGFDDTMEEVEKDMMSAVAAPNLIDGSSYSFSGAGGQLPGAFDSAGAAEVVSAVFAIGNMIVAAIHEIDPDISIDGETLSRKIYPAIRAESNRIGSAMVI